MFDFNIKRKTKKSNIGFIDSGIGGITILNECLKNLKNFHYIYYSDSINNPYGDKKQQELINIIDNIVKYLIKKNVISL